MEYSQARPRKCQRYRPLHRGRFAPLPQTLAEHIHHVLADRPVFASSPITELFANRSFALRVVQDAWYRYLNKLGLIGRRTAEPVAPDYIPQLDIPFEHHDIRVIVDSMFLDGTLHPLAIQGVPVSLPEWAKAGVVQDPAAMRNLVLEGIKPRGVSATLFRRRGVLYGQLRGHCGNLIIRFYK